MKARCSVVIASSFRSRGCEFVFLDPTTRCVRITFFVELLFGQSKEKRKEKIKTLQRPYSDTLTYIIVASAQLNSFALEKIKVNQLYFLYV